MKSSEIRSKYLKFFEEKGHRVVASASLVPDDPGLLFTVAGMVQFKPQFLGQVKLEYTRAVSCQKCIRTKDIENVGRTRRHQTFFEMLGNFSFGDYFKEDAIAWAWEFLTDPQWMGLPKDKLWVSIFEKDDEAGEIWKKHVDASRIFRMGAADNFWVMGPTGPCGPCSEIFYDFGPEADPSVKEGDAANGGERYVEIWNNVFTQFDRQEDGTLVPLPKKNIDTGMGLERLTCVMQGVASTFDTDLFQPIIQLAAAEAKTTYGKDAKTDLSLKVIADHLRGGAFLIADGVLPGNEGRSYVLRRLLRRAIRHGKLLGVEHLFLHQIFPAVEAVFAEAYPELKARKSIIVAALHDEEQRFRKAVDAGMELLDGILKKEAASKRISGDEAFKLYDTFGFPLELTQEIAAERGFTVDEAAFVVEMQKQRERARSAREDGGHGDAAVYGQLATKHGKTRFTGYASLKEAATVLALVIDDAEAGEAESRHEAEVLLDVTPFYAESGGQVGDQGFLKAAGFEARVLGTVKRAGGDLNLHRVRISQGVLKPGMALSAEVDAHERGHIERHHSATHVLHSVLREVLGSHVHQAGSYVGTDRLRLDFSHTKGMNEIEKRQVEDKVNQRIMQNGAGLVRELGIAEAKAEGAMALFGEKYGDTVRVVSFGDFSKELCGGTHVSATGQIGMFRILSESSVSSGVRRIEAVCGELALRHWRETDKFVHELASRLKTSIVELPVRIEKVLAREKELEKKIEKLMQGGGGGEDLLAKVKTVAGVKLLAAEVPEADEVQLKLLGDQYKQKLGSGVLVLGSRGEGKATLVVMVSSDLAARAPAGKIVAAIAPKVGGRGGGKPEMAQAGGKEPAGLDAALAEAEVALLALLT